MSNTRSKSHERLMKERKQTMEKKTYISSIVATSCAILIGAAFADSRTLTVGMPDANGNVAVTIGGTGTENQTLIAAWANSDMGENPLEWTKYADAGTIEPDCTSTNFTIPAEWRANPGVVRFFLMSAEKPYETRYDYITSPDYGGSATGGRFYIDTGIVPDTTLDISVKVQTATPNYTGTCPFGIAGIVCMFTAGDYAGEYYFAFFGAESKVAGTKITRAHVNVMGEAAPKDSNPHTFRICRDGIFFDGYRHYGPFSASDFTVAATSSIVLFARRLAGESEGNWKHGRPCSIYGAEIKTNGVMTCDFVPARESASGKVGMWNRVTGEWKFAVGIDADTKSFTVGNDIGPFPSDCGMVDAVSSVVKFGPTISVLNPNPTARTVDVKLSEGHGAGLLFAFSGAEDCLTEFASWTTNMFVQYVAADVDDVSVTLPEELVRGKQIRFAWKSMAGQPYDYDVEYLHSSTNGAYIDTGCIPKTNTTINVKAKAEYDVCAFGIRNYFYLFYTNDRLYAGFLNGSGNLSIPGDKKDAFVADVHDWKLGASGAYVDDVRVTSFAGLNAVDLLPSVLIPFRKNDTTSAVEKTGDVDVYGAKIWEDGELVRDFVPCVTNGVPVFYDRANGKFLGSKRSGVGFTAGLPVAAEGDIVSWSPVFSLKKGFVISVR